MCIYRLSTYRVTQGGRFRKLDISTAHACNHVVICTASTSSGAAGSCASYSQGQPTAVAFILDSGASSHVIGDRSLFTFYRRIDYANPLVRPVIRMANGTELPILGYGTVHTGSFTIPNVLYVPGVVKNIISCSRLTSMDYNVLLTRNGFSIVEACNAENKIGEGRLLGGLYHMDYLSVPLDRSRCATCVSQEAGVGESEADGSMEQHTSHAH